MKKVGLLLLLICFSFCIFYALMVYDTNGVVKDFEYCINNDVSSALLKDTELYRYYNRSHFYDAEVAKANVNLRRLFIFHNFNKGIMYVNYDCETFDENSNSIYGSTNVYAKWYIEKKDGYWIVTDINEKP